MKAVGLALWAALLAGAQPAAALPATVEVVGRVPAGQAVEFELMFRLRDSAGLD